MTRRTTLVLIIGLAVVLPWSLAGCRVADQRPNAEDLDGGLRTSSAGNLSSGADQHTEISNGKIVFKRHSDIYVMNSDGTGQTNLTSAKSGVGRGVWSPDGKKIAFFGRAAGERSLDIYVINADGTGETNLTRTKTSSEDAPSWSPDGKHIAFTRADAGDVYVDQDVYLMNADGTGRTRLASNASSPSFAPRDK
jgi:Tol biopolymer transport system component